MLRCSCLVALLLTACHAPADTSPDFAVGDGGAGDGAMSSVDLAPLGFALVQMQPAMVAFRGETVTLVYQGTPPSTISCPPGQAGQFCSLTFWVDGVRLSPSCGLDPQVSPACPPSAWTVQLPRSDGSIPSTITISARDGNDHEIARLDPAGSYLPPVPPTPTLLANAGPYGGAPLGTPLAPELARPCARGTMALVVNHGDLPFNVSSLSLSGDTAFSLHADPCSGTQVGVEGSSNGGVAGNECGPITVCFSSATPGSHAATLTAVTSAGTVTAALSATVSAASSGFDGTVAVVPVDIISTWNGGAVPVRPSQTPAALLGSGVMVYAAPQGLSYVAGDGTVTSFSSVGAVYGLASAPDFASVYRASDSYTDRWTTSGLDASFGSGGKASGGISSTVGATNLGAIAVAPNGNIFLDSFQASIQALSSTGAMDTAVGNNGYLYLSTEDSMIADAQGRLYVGLRSYTDATHFTDSLARFSTVDGSRDTAFSYAASGILALDAQSRLYVAEGSSVVRLDDAGNATPLTLTTPFALGDGIYDLAFDPNGKLLLAHGSDRVLRFLSDGSFDAQLGLPGALRVLCPAQGGCWVVGRAIAGGDGYVARLAL